MSDITETPVVETAEATTNPPLPGSYPDLYSHYGDPRSNGFEAQHIVPVALPFASGQIHTVTCHKLIKPVLIKVWQRLKESGALQQLKSYDGCFVVRDIRGNSNPSVHSWGLAIDINAAQFGLGSDARQNHDVTVAFEAEGFFYGGDFYRRKDPMHYQYTKPHTI